MEIQVEVPRRLNERQEELLRELAELEDTNVMPHQKSFFDHVKNFFAGDDDEEE